MCIQSGRAMVWRIEEDADGGGGRAVRSLESGVRRYGSRNSKLETGKSGEASLKVSKSKVLRSESKVGNSKLQSHEEAAISMGGVYTMCVQDDERKESVE